LFDRGRAPVASGSSFSRKTERRERDDVPSGSRSELPRSVLTERVNVADLIGWSAALMLLLTVGRQVYTQCRDGVSTGESKWFFIGQSAASIAFVVYSWLLESWVFLVTNAAMLVVAVLGQIILHRNRSRAPPQTGAPPSA
jgi:MtN3 and saliva related transmembrane protein